METYRLLWTMVSRRNTGEEMLWTLSHKSPLPWCCAGDYYNDLLFRKEKRGRLCHPVGLLQGFREATETSRLQDLGMIGYPFLWLHNHGYPNSLIP